MANLTEWWWAGKVNCLDRNQVCKGGFISQCSLGGGIGNWNVSVTLPKIALSPVTLASGYSLSQKKF